MPTFSLPGISLRPAQSEDIHQIVTLDRLAFAPLKSQTEIQHEWYGEGLNLPGRQLFLAIEEATSRGIGTYTQLQLAIHFQHQVFPAMGIAAVAVALQKRGQKIARFMLEHALETARAQQLPIVMLYPFQHGFYRRLGWAWVESVHQYRIATRHLPLYPERSGIVPYDSTQHDLSQVYQSVATQHNGWLQRQDWQWQQRLKPSNGREIYVYQAANQIQGYVICQFAHLGTPQSPLAIIVQEWVASTAAAYRGILGFLAALRDQLSTIVWNTFPTDPFPHLLQEQRRDSALAGLPFEFGLVHSLGQIGGGFMWRLVDIAAAFQRRSLQTSDAFALTFHITDPVLGDQQLTAEFSDRQMQVSSQPTATVLKTSIDHLTELFYGVRRSQDLLWTGELELEGDDTLLPKLDQAWQATPPFCWDFF
ncbi:GNAT family N-acetyltransferase [Pantanalinema sp. GBBB05]|uniref:GNAT family N-acetyltransferase n=1 Tax=Pantanalinema sp. GBBB05 TaxID=2604139 RepID=UPI001DF71AAD|nr:GNAT family N-acetyltransferase [Pantanalinema sp. GBBB05]